MELDLAAEQESADATLFATVTFPPELFEALAQRAAEINAERDEGYLDYEASGEFLCTTAKAVARMKERGILVPDAYNGRKPLFLRSTLRAAVRA